jgi:two-component system chemotaxis response regulator CheB
MAGERIEVKIGDVVVVDQGQTLSAVLGTCAGVCLFDQKLRIGGMVHYFFPEENTSSGSEKPNAFGANAIPSLLKKFKDKNTNPKDLVAWIVGGAQSDITPSAAGEENIALAEALLEKFGIEIRSKTVGGNSGREVRFNTHSGEVLSRKIPKTGPKAGPKKIKVLIVEDSVPIQTILVRALSDDPDFEVIGVAASTAEADRIRKKITPDVISLDVNLPGEDGPAYLKRYMPRDPIPALIVTAITREDSRSVVNALEFGAFDWLTKPTHSELDSFAKDYKERLKIGARQNARAQARKEARKTPDYRDLTPEIQKYAPNINKLGFSPEAIYDGLILIGTSTGGPEALHKVLPGLPSQIPPILVVQHMPAHFTESLALRLNELCEFSVVEAKDKMRLEKNHVYIAPGGFHLKIVRQSSGTLEIAITSDPPVNLFRPSVDYMFESAATNVKHKHIVAVVLTGMGKDGAAGLLKLKNSGRSWNIAQDEESSIVYGMPKAAFEMGATNEVKPLDDMAAQIVKSLNLQTQKKLAG